MVVSLDRSHSLLTSEGSARGQRSLSVDRKTREKAYGIRFFSDYQVEKSIIRPPDLNLHPLTSEGHVKGVKGHEVWLSISVPKSREILGSKGCQNQRYCPLISHLHPWPPRVKDHEVWLSISVPKASEILSLKGCQSQRYSPLISHLHPWPPMALQGVKGHHVCTSKLGKCVWHQRFQGLPLP
jgi:hypothetical protein